ncbi:MAG: hypothetical protein KI786_19220 [Mameliella sp.]|nr:hypothetical protein [Phaeodactylibacter sp.]
MDLNWLYQTASNAISTIFSEIFFTSLGMSFLGLVSGIIVIVVLRRKGVFSRPNMFWSFLAKLNYLFIPVCFTALFGVLGGIYGLQSQTEEWIDYSAQPVMAFGEQILPVVGEMGEELSAYSNLDEAISGFSEANLNQGGFFDFTIGYMLNHGIHMLLEEFGYPETVSGIIQMTKENNFSEPAAATLQRIPEAVKSYHGVFFQKIYLTTILAFVPYLLIPIAEYALFLIISSFKSRNSRIAKVEDLNPAHV